MQAHFAATQRRRIGSAALAASRPTRSPMRGGQGAATMGASHGPWRCGPGIGANGEALLALGDEASESESSSA